jgi:C-methyltransferase
MPGVYLPIVDPQVSRDSPPDYFLVLAWNYIESILDQEQTLHNNGTKFIIPFPQIKII